MNLIEIAQFIAIIGLVISSVYVGKLNAQSMKKFREYEKVRKTLYASLADPDTVQADFEKSARAREMYDANRTTLPRENTNPPAKVYRPKLRGKRPGNWRVNNPNKNWTQE